MAGRLIPLDEFGPDGWRMAGHGRFRPVGDGVIESTGGSGLLWYAAEVFADFLLEIDWRTSGPEDNSGVFVRIPPLGDDIEPAIRCGYEIQIDDRGVNPEAGRTGDPLHLTGAIYGLAPALAQVSRGPGAWNRFRITAEGPRIQAELNGALVSRLGEGDRNRAGHLALQNHHSGSAVQFRRLIVMSCLPGSAHRSDLGSR